MLRRSATPPDSRIYRNRRKALPRPPPWFCSSSPADLCSGLVIRLQGEAAGVNLCSYKIVKQSYFPVSCREKGGSSLDMVQLSKHRVLIINDDGIHATGILLLKKIVRQFTEDVWVVAPDEEKSGASHSISMNIPVRVREIDSRHFAIKGTPTDCALLAIYEIMKMRPTILLSGINRGANLAEDITYSGTAAAAME